MFSLTALMVLLEISIRVLLAEDQEYTLNFDSPIYVCPDEESQAFVDTSEVEVIRYNESTAMMTGVIKFMKGFEPQTMIEMIIEKETGATLEMVASHEICDVCQELDNPVSIYSEYLPYFGFPETCPFEPNDYPINDFVADTKNLPINSENAGRYQVTMNMHKTMDGTCLSERIFVACLKLDFLVEPL